MIAKYKWYFLAVAALLIGVLVYRKFYRKAPKSVSSSIANQGDLTVTDGSTSTKEMKQMILRQDLDHILN